MPEDSTLGIGTDAGFLPQNNPDISTFIDQATIKGFMPDGFTERSSYEQELINNQNLLNQPNEIGPQGSAALYPGLSQGINVGTTSGSIIGSHGVYVPSGDILPMDPILARRKAVDDAAKRRASEIKPFEYRKPLDLKDSRFQGNFNQSVFDFQDKAIKEAQNKYGIDFAKHLKDPGTKEGRKFIQGMANFETMGKNFDQIVDLIAEMDKGLQDKTKVYTPETMKLYNDFKGLVGNFEDGDIMGSIDLQTHLQKFQGHRSFEDYIQTDNFLKDFNGRISQSFTLYDKENYYRTGTTKKVEFEDAINEVVNSLAERDFAPEIASGIYDKAYLKKTIRARLEDSNITTGGITKKSDQEIEKNEGTQINAWEDNRQDYNPEDPKSQILFTYDAKGNRLERQNEVRVVEDFNMKHDGGVTTKINERLDGKIQTQDFKGVPISGLEVLGNDYKSETIPGNSLASFNTMSRTNWGDIIIMANVAVPTRQTAKTMDEDVGFDSYTTQSRAVILFKGGKGTGMKAKIAATIKNDKAREEFERGYDHLIERTKSKESKPKPSTESKPKTVTQDGVTYILDEKTGEYNAR